MMGTCLAILAISFPRIHVGSASSRLRTKLSVLVDLLGFEAYLLAIRPTILWLSFSITSLVKNSLIIVLPFVPPFMNRLVQDSAGILSQLNVKIGGLESIITLKSLYH